MHAVDFNNKLYKLLCEDDDTDESECSRSCLISGEPLRDNSIKLSCNHRFNFENIFYEVSKQKDKNYLETCKLSLGEIKCPYCRSVQKGLLPLNKEFPNLRKRGVNLPKSLIYKPNKCIHIMIGGKNKGLPCNISCYNKYCEKHDKINKEKENVIRCQSILKSGKRKGEMCMCICKSEESKSLSLCKKHIKTKI